MQHVLNIVTILSFPIPCPIPIRSRKCNTLSGPFFSLIAKCHPHFSLFPVIAWSGLARARPAYPGVEATKPQ